MLSTELSLFLAILATFIVIVLTFFSWRIARAVQYARSCAEFVSNQNAESLSLRRLAEIESSLTELTDAHHALYESNKKLRARITMRQNRAAKNGAGDDLPDPKTDPDGWKRAMRVRLHQDKLT